LHGVDFQKFEFLERIRALGGALKARGVIDEIMQLPPSMTLEGAGDCIWDPGRRLFWMGSGFRTDAAAGRVLEQHFGVRCLTLVFADPSFYHLDTAFSVLPCGGVIYYPAAFTSAALATIHDHVAPGDRIALDHADATRFAANAVCLGRSLVLSSCSETLRRDLEERGYAVIETPLHAFLRSGGSAPTALSLPTSRAAKIAGVKSWETHGNRIAHKSLVPARSLHPRR
jgi:N-dimethylarginine dimethylaminohydrolase